MKNKWVAYFLWLISGFGWFGLHNFYLNRHWRGIIWIFTQGLFWFGSAFDLLTIHKTVKDINDKFSYNNYLPSTTEFSNTNQSNYTAQKTVKRETASHLHLKDFFDTEVSNSNSQNRYEPLSITIKNGFGKFQKDSDVEYISSKETPSFDFPKNENEDRNNTSNYNYNDYYDRSKIYKTKLDLSISEIELIKYYRNSYRIFVEIEFCDLETVKLTLHLYHQLENLFKSRKIDLEKKLSKEHKKIIEDKKKEHLELYDYVPNWLESDYNYYSPKSYLLGHLQQIAENTLRLKYNYNRQVETKYAFNYLEENFNYGKEYIEKLLSIYNYSNPDLAAEISINEHCTTRWKKEILELELKDYDNLVSRNIKNTSSFRLLHSCAKNCIKQDERIKGIEFILLSMLKAPKIKNRPSLTATEIRKLFRNENEKLKFEKFAKGLSKETEDSDIKSFAENFYYKNVVLSQDAINEANQKHEAISSKVGVYLKDDEDESKIEKTYKKNKKVALNEILNTSDKTIELTEKETIIINFIKDKSEVSIEEVTLFSKSKSLRLKKIVNAVNKKSFEVHEESLIILDEDSYSLNTEILEEISI